MKTTLTRITAIVAASGLTLALPVAGALAAGMPAPHKEGTATYIMGGAAQEQADAMKHVAKYYPLELQFMPGVKPKDGHVSDVTVRIKDPHDKMVLNVMTESPLMLVKLPAGKYIVSAEHNGKLERHAVEIVRDHHQRVVFEWQQA